MERDTGQNKRRQAEERKDPAIRLRIPTLIMALFLAVVAIAAAYLAGVMSGRHAAPSFTERSGTASASLAQSPDIDDNDGSAAKKSNKEEHILSAEELEFARVLRRDENTPLNKLKSNPEKNAEPEKKDPASVDNPPIPDTAPKQSLQKSLEAEKSGETADYIFQVGAFKDEKTVDSLREKLEGHGLRTMMQREGKLYLVLVRLRGTANRAAELVALLGELGLGEPIIRRRSLVKP